MVHGWLESNNIQNLISWRDEVSLSSSYHSDLERSLHYQHLITLTS